jgi:hypothetical protein
LVATLTDSQPTNQIPSKKPTLTPLEFSLTKKKTLSIFFESKKEKKTKSQKKRDGEMQTKVCPKF